MKKPRLKVGSRIVISRIDEDYICEVKEVRKNPKVNGLEMDYYLLTRENDGDLQTV